MFSDHVNSDALLERAAKRQAQARRILDELGLVNLWSPYGRPVVVGSVSTGLVVEPDIDMEVYSDDPRIADGFRVMAAVAESKNVIRIDYKKHSRADGGWLYWEIHYRAGDGVVWTIETYFCTPHSPYAGGTERFAGELERVLTDEHRVAILAIKEALCANGTMRDTKSFYVYRAVIEGGVRSFDDYTAWMEANKPDGVMEWTPDAAGRSGNGPR